MVQTKEAQAVAAARERRAEPRTKTAQSVLITVSNLLPVEAWLLDISSSGARVRMPVRVETGCKLKMEAKDVLLYGTVVRCISVHRAYEVGLSLSHPLELLVEMRRLNSALLAE